MATTDISFDYRYNYSAPYSCDRGDLIRLFASFFDESSLVLDPDTVKLRVKKPDGSETAYNYPPEITKTGIGQYYCDINANVEGTWYYRWECTGTGQCAAERVFTVKHSYFS